jgi:hypothetical protein
MSLGARYDAWLTTQPEEPDLPMPGDEFYPRCCRCGGFLRRDPDRVTSHEQAGQCDGQPLDFYMTLCGALAAHEPHTFTVAAWGELHRTCKKCGHENTEVES